MTSNDVVDALGRGLVSVQAGDEIDHLDGGVLGLATFGGAGQASDLFSPGPVVSQHSGGRDDLQLAVHEPSMAGVYLQIPDWKLAPRVAFGP